MIMRKISQFSVLLIFLTLFGCKENLYSELSEQDVNMMIAILEQNGIEAERYKDEPNKFSLRVDSEDFTTSVKVLAAKGYPKKKFQSMADVFTSEGIVKTPFEQRARFIHALNQELSKSISDIEGIISARVHITQPEISRFGKAKEKPRAAVVILHYPKKDMSGMRPKIKQLIAHSVNGMTYENVTVVMSAVDGVNSKNDAVDEANIRRYANAKITDISIDSGENSSAAKIGAKEQPYTGSYIFTGLTSRKFLSWLLGIIGIALAVASVFIWRKAKQNDS